MNVLVRFVTAFFVQQKQTDTLGRRCSMLV